MSLYTWGMEQGMERRSCANGGLGYGDTYEFGSRTASCDHRGITRDIRRIVKDLFSIDNTNACFIHDSKE